MTVLAKICGITSEAALQASLDGGADFVGLVFFAKSPRNVDTARARLLRDQVPRGGRCKVVALVVDADDDQLTRIVRDVEPDMLQLHGTESIERVRQVRARWGLPLIKALAVATAADAEAGRSYVSPGSAADIILYDAKPDPQMNLPGGNGLSFDWHILEAVKGRMPFALAGGLTPDNIVAAIECTGANIVDVSSGVETAPGVKSPELIRRFLRNAKEAKQV